MNIAIKFIINTNNIKLIFIDVILIKSFYIKFNEETDEDDNRPQCCIDHDKYFSTCDNCEFGE